LLFAIPGIVLTGVFALVGLIAVVQLLLAGN